MESDRYNYRIARCTVAFIWIYHGLVPKLFGPHSDELAMITAVGLTNNQAIGVSYLGGIGEIIFGFVLLLFWKSRWPLLLSAFSMVGLLIFVVFAQPHLALGAFNPVSTNLSACALSVLAYRMPSNWPSSS